MKKILIILLAVLSVLCVFTSCSDGSSRAAEKAEEKTTAYYTVTFKTGIDTTVEAQKIESGTKATAPDTSSFTKEGYEFEGWLLDGDEYNFNAPVTKDIVLVAKWAMKCTVVFLDVDGETAICDVQIVDYRDKATKPANPVKAGYTFIKWVERDRAEYNFERPVWNTYLELFAVWEANEYTVTYDANGASVSTAVPSSDKYTYGKSFTASGITASGFSKVGCIFKGWALTKDGEIAYKPGDDVTGEPNNMTLYAVWEDPEYTDGGAQTGPSGGTIIAVNPDFDEDSTWKYIELASNPLPAPYCFGYYRLEPAEDTHNNKKVDGTSDALGAGKANTERLIKIMDDEAPTAESSETVQVKTSGEESTVAKLYDSKAVYAAKACADYELEYDGNTYDDWYLPSAEELCHTLLRHVKTGFYATSIEENENNCKVVLIINQEISGFPAPTQMGTRSMAKSYSTDVLPIRYF